jgi:predicted dienelactone hydrolase
VRTFEVVLLVVALATALLTLGALRRVSARSRPTTRSPASHSRVLLVAAGTLATSLIAHVTVEGLRWQFVPVSLGSLLLVTVLVIRTTGRTAPLVRSIAAVTALSAALSSALGWALPVQVLPAPTGPHEIATTTLVLRDEARIERYGPQPGGPREIAVQLWYPARPGSTTGRTPATLIPGARAFVGLAAAEFGLPAFALGHLVQVRGHAVTDAPALEGELLPLVVLSHGWTGFRVVQADLAEQLASAGYVVAAPDHTYGALLASFPDGRSLPFDPAALPDWETTTTEDYERASRSLVATFADDLSLVIDALVTAPPEALVGRLDGSRIAFLGHSTGGGASIAACAATPQCTAVVGFDPWVDPVDPAVQDAGIAAPLLSIRTEDWSERPNEERLTELHRQQLRRGATQGRVLIPGALHRDYTLVPALSPLGRLLDLEGETPGRLTRAASIVWTQRFLDHHLRGAGSDPLLDPPSGGVAVLEPAVPTEAHR